ncbi:MAG: prepilin-type N-terminal cleavage/methylation domain-containing protein, partial [Candidatus Omnitrophica bacterium]|nr:prepilin-type N-terminal cleavage/methylation domain-containing protein [Candidatus Omnitrophota bacterium]
MRYRSQNRTCVSRLVTSPAFPRGWTLLELLVVLIIVGVLAAIAVPAYFHFVEKARQTEAVSNLGSIRRAQLAHQAETGRFVAAPDLSSIKEELDLDIQPEYFDYKVVRASEDTFLAEATQTGFVLPGQEAPRVTIDEAGNVVYFPGGKPLGPFDYGEGGGGAGEDTGPAGGGGGGSGSSGGGGSGGGGGGSSGGGSSG